MVLVHIGIAQSIKVRGHIGFQKLTGGGLLAWARAGQMMKRVILPKFVWFGV